VKKVLLFTMEGIADGEAALAFFQARGAAVEVRDVGRDPEASQEVFRLAGRLAVPTVLIDERVFLGFSAHREEIETLMREWILVILALAAAQWWTGTSRGSSVVEQLIRNQ
jgi:Glutaredoxin